MIAVKKALQMMVSMLFLASGSLGGQVASSPQCRVTEQAIFHECDTTKKPHDGTMRKEDLTVEGLAIGEATLDNVASRFPGSQKFRLTKGEGAPLGICVKNRDGYGVVFASGYAGGWKILDSIYLAPAKSLESQGAYCQSISSLPGTLSTESGIGIGIEREKLRTLLPNLAIQGSFFEADYSTSPDKAPWASHETPSPSEGWKATSGVMGGLRDGKLRWLVVYGAVLD